MPALISVFLFLSRTPAYITRSQTSASRGVSLYEQLSRVIINTDDDDNKIYTALRVKLQRRWGINQPNEQDKFVKGTT